MTTKFEQVTEYGITTIAAITYNTDGTTPRNAVVFWDIMRPFRTVEVMNYADCDQAEILSSGYGNLTPDEAMCHAKAMIVAATIATKINARKNYYV